MAPLARARFDFADPASTGVVWVRLLDETTGREVVATELASLIHMRRAGVLAGAVKLAAEAAMDPAELAALVAHEEGS